MTIEFAEDEPAVPDEDAFAAVPAVAPAGRQPSIAPRSLAHSISAQLFAWSMDIFIVIGCAGLHLAMAKMIHGVHRGPDASADY